MRHMRIAAVTLGLAALVSTGLTAQAPAHQHSLLPAHKARLSVDFGMKKAMQKLAQRPPDCDKDRTPRHKLLPRLVFVELPVYGGHQVRTVPAAPCSVR